MHIPAKIHPPDFFTESLRISMSACLWTRVPSAVRGGNSELVYNTQSLILDSRHFERVTPDDRRCEAVLTGTNQITDDVKILCVMSFVTERVCVCE